jgi:hypothetical protein
MEPALNCVAALLSSETGIIDSHAFMLALEGDLEDRGGMIAFNTPVEALRYTATAGRCASAAPTAGSLRGRCGDQLGGSARRRSRAPRKASPRRACRVSVLAKGNYFGFAGKPAFSHLIYPAPVEAGSAPTSRSTWPAHALRPGRRVDRRGELHRSIRSAPTRSTPACRTYFPGAARQLAGAGLLRHPSEAHRQGRAGRGLPDRRPALTACRGLVHLFGIESPD